MKYHANFCCKENEELNKKIEEFKLIKEDEKRNKIKNIQERT